MAYVCNVSVLPFITTPAADQCIKSSLSVLATCRTALPSIFPHVRVIATYLFRVGAQKALLWVSPRALTPSILATGDHFRPSFEALVTRLVLRKMALYRRSGSVS